MIRIFNFFKRHHKFIKSINKNLLGNQIILIYFYLKTELLKITNKFFLNSNYNNEESINITKNWYTNNAIYWLLLEKKFNLSQKKMNVLEIGSFEGASTCFFLNKFKNSNIFCVDTWSEDFIEGTSDKNCNFYEVEKRFDQNVAKYYDRVKKFKMMSNSFFLKIEYKDNFDLIYVDGAHDYDSVIKDALNAFIFLKKDGLLIFDDFLRNQTHEAIMKFFEDYKESLKIIFVYGQIIFKKI